MRLFASLSDRQRQRSPYTGSNVSEFSERDREEPSEGISEWSDPHVPRSTWLDAASQESSVGIEARTDADDAPMAEQGLHTQGNGDHDSDDDDELFRHMPEFTEAEIQAAAAYDD